MGRINHRRLLNELNNERIHYTYNTTMTIIDYTLNKRYGSTLFQYILYNAWLEQKQ